MAVKGLTADGSTRAWRKMRAQVLKRAGVKDTKGVEVNHKRARRHGGKDVASNLEPIHYKRNRPGRPKRRRRAKA